MASVLVSTFPFARHDPGPLTLMREANLDVRLNPLERRLRTSELADLLGDTDILIAGTEPITLDVLRQAPRLRLIARVGIGLDNVPLLEARAAGIRVCYTPDGPSPAVAELTIGLMLSLLRGIHGADRRVRDGSWHRVLGRRLGDVTVGIVGVGRVGRLVARHLGGFPGVRILANDLRPDEAFGRQHGLEWKDKDTVYRDADIITLHLPLTAATRRLITGREIERMKPGVLLVNTSRGNMIDEAELAAALRAGRVGGAAIDVFEHEPYGGELIGVDRAVLTCHMGSMTEDCRARMEMEAAQDVVRFARGEPLLREVPEEEFQIAAEAGPAAARVS
jgi:D-3-phosphoglycerate dehydrogenase